MVTKPGLLAQDVCVTAGRKTLFQADEVKFEPGMTAVVGPNGAGKTSLLRGAAGLAGRARIAVAGEALNDLPASERARRIAYLAQRPVFHWPLTVRAVVGLGRYPHGAEGIAGADRDAVDKAMDDAGVMAFADRPVSTLSGGEQARVALARALAVDAAVLLADEPAAALDPQFHLAVFDLLRSLADRGRVVVVVTHDLNAALRYADRCLVVDDGRIVVHDGPERALSAETLASVFAVRPHFTSIGGRQLVTAFDPAS